MSAEHLEQKGFENARLNAERLLGHVLNLNRVELYLHFERPIAEEELAQFKVLLQRRLKHEPLQYLLQQTEFMSLPFKVGPAVLIPRPETELLVEQVLTECKTRFPALPEISILDIGTGSGNIAISLAKNLPAAKVTALDVSAEALMLARENAELNAVGEQIRFVNGDVRSVNLEQQFRVIVSNPPYITQKEMLELPPEVRYYEPKTALAGGVDGLDFYRLIIQRMAQKLMPHGFMAFEIGYQQAAGVKQIFHKSQFTDVKVFQDLNAHDRIIIASQ